MAKARKRFKCTNCGTIYPRWAGQCTPPNGCGMWNTIEEDVENVIESRQSKSLKARSKGINRATKLTEVDSDSEERFITGIDEFDRVLGGGIVRGSIVIVTAPPGTGKSTLLLAVCDAVGKKGLKVVYASGEESERQIKLRANRIIKGLSENVYVAPGDNLDDIFVSVDEHDAELLIIDSIQTCSVDYLDSKTGGNAQILECAERIRQKAKNEKKNLMVILIGQMTKEDELAGSRQLEHLVDTVLKFEVQEEVRMLRGTKNRFGDTGEIGAFEMDSDGLTELKDLSKYFVTEREVPIPGSALAVTKEGTRPIIVEVECATSRSLAPFPARYTEGIRKEKLNILLGVLEGSGINFFEENVMIKPTGGMRINENATDLAMIMSIVSAKKKKAIPNGTVFIGEIGLTGEIKKVPSIEMRLKELDRMGFREAIIPNQMLKCNTDDLNIKITKMKTISDCIRYILPTTSK